MNKHYLKHTRADHLYRPAVQLVLKLKVRSVSRLQREFRIGYNRALRFVGWMVVERIIRFDETGGWVVIMTHPNKRKKYLSK